MSLDGSLSTMPLAELLEWIRATNRTGVLTVRNGDSETTLKVKAKRIVECAAQDPPVLLGQFLLFHGLIDENALDAAMREHVATGQRLGDVLIAKGAVGTGEMGAALRAKAEETILCAFEHRTGHFVFEPEATDLDSPLSMDLPIADAIARAEHRIQTSRLAKELLVRDGFVLRKTAKEPSGTPYSAWPLRRAYELVDGQREIDEIILHMHGTEFHVIERLRQLYVEGFLEHVEKNVDDPWIGLDLEDHSIDLAAIPESLSEPGTELAPADPMSIVPVPLQSQLALKSGSLSMVEKYLITLCDGQSDLRRITAVAPIQSQVVIDTIQGLIDRGWLKVGDPMSIKRPSPN